MGNFGTDLPSSMNFIGGFQVQVKVDLKFGLFTYWLLCCCLLFVVCCCWQPQTCMQFQLENFYLFVVVVSHSQPTTSPVRNSSTVYEVLVYLLVAQASTKETAKKWNQQTSV